MNIKKIIIKISILSLVMISISNSSITPSHSKYIKENDNALLYKTNISYTPSLYSRLNTFNLESSDGDKVVYTFNFTRDFDKESNTLLRTNSSYGKYTIEVENTCNITEITYGTTKKDNINSNEYELVFTTTNESEKDITLKVSCIAEEIIKDNKLTTEYKVYQTYSDTDKYLLLKDKFELDLDEFTNATTILLEIDEEPTKAPITLSKPSNVQQVTKPIIKEPEETEEVIDIKDLYEPVSIKEINSSSLYEPIEIVEINKSTLYEPIEIVEINKSTLYEPITIKEINVSSKVEETEEPIDEIEN